MENENKEKTSAKDHVTKVFAAITGKNGAEDKEGARPNYLKVVLLILVALTAAAIVTVLAVGKIGRAHV